MMIDPSQHLLTPEQAESMRRTLRMRDRMASVIHDHALSCMDGPRLSIDDAYEYADAVLPLVLGWVQDAVTGS